MVLLLFPFTVSKNYFHAVKIINLDEKNIFHGVKTNNHGMKIIVYPGVGADKRILFPVILYV